MLIDQYLTSKDYLQDLLGHILLKIYFSNQQFDQPHRQNYLVVWASE
jgi:hypothetical protein